MGDESCWLTADEAARWLRVSRSKLYQMASAHEIPHARLPGRGVRFNRESLEQWLKSLERGGNSGKEKGYAER